jgi:methionyl-tRNA synthetase
MLYPIIPQSVIKALNIFGINEKEIKISTLENHYFLKPNSNISKIDILFKKIEKNND